MKTNSIKEQAEVVWGHPFMVSTQGFRVYTVKRPITLKNIFLENYVMSFLERTSLINGCSHRVTFSASSI